MGGKRIICLLCILQTYFEPSPFYSQALLLLGKEEKFY